MGKKSRKKQERQQAPAAQQIEVISKSKKSFTYKTAGIIGAAIVGIGIVYGIATHAFTAKNVANHQQTQSQTGLESYITEMDVTGEDPKKRNLYIIFQRHALNQDSIPEEFKQYSADTSRENQVSVYRIIEGLHKNAGLELVLNEGVGENSSLNLNQEKSKIREMFPKIVDAIDHGNDDILAKLLESDPTMGGADYAAALNPAIKMTGYENTKTGGTNENIRKYLGQKKDGTFDIKLAEEGRKQQEKDVSERSMQAVRLALKQSEELYQNRAIHNRDSAIVIGYGHKKDYEPLFETVKKTGEYNLIFIVPKGIK